MSSSLSCTPNLMSSNHNGTYSNSNQNTLIQNYKQTNPKAAKFLADFKQINLELRAQNFDVIRFATYRTASKLRFIQKKLNLHLIDLWNVIETFRDNNIHTLDLHCEIETNKIESCIQNMYIELNKRLALNQHINVDTQTQLLTAWLLNLYDKNRYNRIKVISFKVALTTMCAGKLTDKIKYIFNQISDPNKNCLVIQKFEIYLKELLTLPTSVFEEPSFGYNENLSKTCFDLSSPVRLNDFLNVALSDLGPACFIWLNIFHRFTVVQNVQHPVSCSVCKRSHFNGFRYKCQKCRKYQLCQDCFWRGRVSNSHQLTHQMKEYTSYKSAAKQFSNTLKKSFFCKPNNKLTRQQQQQQQLLQERQSQLLQQKPVEIHQLTYQKQYDYEKALSQQNFIKEKQNMSIANKSTCHENNSDYNLLHRTEGKLNGVQVPTMGSVTNGYHETSNYSANSTLNRSFKKGNLNANTSSLGINEGQFQKPIDLNHIIPPSYMNETQSNHQTNNYQSSSLKKTKAQAYSMTKAKQSDPLNTCPSLISKFLNGSNVSPNENQPQDEHGMIANYSALLSEFYAKNPHLASSPTTCPTSHSPLIGIHSQKLKPTIKSNNQYRSNIQYDSSLQRQNRTASLQRTAYPSSHRLSSKSPMNNNSFYNSNYMNGSSTISSKHHSGYKSHSIQPNTTRSVSECNFRTKNDLDDFEDTCQEEVLLKEKREIVAKLERQNKEIINEINRLKQQQISNKSLDNEPSSTKDAWILQQQLQQKLKSRESTPVMSTLTRQKNEINQLLNQNPHLKALLAKISSGNTAINPQLLSELQTLKTRKGMLENRMNALESSRDELIGRLTQLDSSYINYDSPILSKKKINSHSLRTTPVNSPKPVRNLHLTQQQTTNIPDESIYTNTSSSTFMPIVSASMAMPVLSNQQPQRSGIITNINHQPTNISTIYSQPRSWSTPTTPAINEIHTTRQSKLQIPGSASSLVSATSNTSLCSNSSNYNSLTRTSNLKNLRNDLLIAADSVTNAMQGLVRELNSENESVCYGEDDGKSITFNETNQFYSNNHASEENTDIETVLNNNKKIYSMDQLINRPISSYSNPPSSANTPVLFRRNNFNSQDTTTRLLQKQMQINPDSPNSQINLTGYRNGINLDNFNMDLLNEPENSDLSANYNGHTPNTHAEYEGDDEENCMINGSYIEDYDLNKFNPIDPQGLQTEFELQQQEQFQQQQEIEFESNLLAENLTNNTNEQVASWRRELEQRLLDDNSSNNEPELANQTINGVNTNSNDGTEDINNNIESLCNQNLKSGECELDKAVKTEMEKTKQ